MIGDLPMVEWVRRKLQESASLDRVVVAAEDKEIVDLVCAMGGEAILTPPCANGTERVFLACEALGFEDELVVNVQGDMPGIDPLHIDAVIDLLRTGDSKFATAAVHMDDESLARSAEIVKVVIDDRQRALYFSREPVPFGGPWLRHLGIYGFSMDVLRQYMATAEGELSKSEDLEQLRWLESGGTISVAVLEEALPSVDTVEQLEALRLLVRNGNLKYPA
jgi:3-deoxy-manno-octulosonate cytidylyltransferase (CMP-KDO synthetase)